MNSSTPTAGEPMRQPPAAVPGRDGWLGRTLTRPVLGAGLFYALAAIALTWPAFFALRRVLIGHPGNDTWNHVWGFWWVAQEVLEKGQWPAWTNLIAWPKGGALYFIDTFNAMITLPIQAVVGPVATHNLIVMGSLWFTAFCGWLLARHVVRDDGAALVAGAIYGFSPHLLAQAHNAITESLNAGWLALYLLLFIRLLERPSVHRGLAAWAAIVACGLFNWYYGLFAGLATGILLLHRALASTTPIFWKRALKWGLVGAVPFAPLAAGGLYLLASSMNAPDALVNRDPDFVWNSLIYHNMTDLQCYFRPGHFYSPDLKALYGEDLLIVTYLGWLVLGLAGWAVLRHRRRGELAPWIWVGAVFWVFSLGPYLYAFDHYVQVQGRRIPLPFLAFFEALPIFSRISHPFRFVVGVELALGILAAFAVRDLRRRRAPRQALWLPIGVALLVLAEICLLSPARVPLAKSRALVPAAYAALRGDPEPGAVLDLPIAVPILERAVYNWYQVYHHRPIPYTLNEPIPPGLRHNQFCQFLLNLEAGRARLLPRTLPDLELVVSARILARQGYRYVVLHEDLYPEVKLRQVKTILNALLGPPLQTSEGAVSVYRLPWTGL